MRVKTNAARTGNEKVCGHACMDRLAGCHNYGAEEEGKRVTNLGEVWSARVAISAVE